MMQLLMLDFEDIRRRPGRIDVGLLIAGFIIMSVSGYVAATLFPSISALETELSLRNSAAADEDTKSVRPTVDERYLRAELKQANNVIGLLGLPWDMLFTDIESTQNAHVALLAVEPDPEKHTLSLTAEAKDFPAMLAYMRLLQSRPSLKDVYLKSHTIDINSAERPVRFVIVASWVLQP